MEFKSINCFYNFILGLISPYSLLVIYGFFTLLSFGDFLEIDPPYNNDFHLVPFLMGIVLSVIYLALIIVPNIKFYKKKGKKIMLPNILVFVIGFVLGSFLLYFVK